MTMSVGDFSHVWLSFSFAGEGDKESEYSPLVETFCFLLFLFLFVILHWDSCFLLAKESFSLFLCLSRLTWVDFSPLLSLLLSSFTWLDLSLESLPMIKICQYWILTETLKILKCRYLIYDNIGSFHITRQNWRRKRGMDSSIVKKSKSWNTVFIIAFQLYWSHTLAWVFSCKFPACFQNTFSQERLWTDASDNRS